MADAPKAQESSEKETQTEAMPASDQKTTIDESAEVGASEASAKETDIGELPEGAKERTSEQFEKLKDNYRREREKRIELEKTFQDMQLKPKPQQQPVDDWYNPETGEVDINKLRQERQREANRIAQLEQQVQGVQAQTQAQQEKEVFDLYPELNPSGEKFDEDLHDAVTGYLTGAFLKGKNPSFKEGAEAVMKIAKKEATRSAQTAEKEGAKKALEQLSPKEQAALEATGRSDRRPHGRDLETLSRESRRGDARGIEAIVERMKGISSVGK